LRTPPWDWAGQEFQTRVFLEVFLKNGHAGFAKTGGQSKKIRGKFWKIAIYDMSLCCRFRRKKTPGLPEALRAGILAMVQAAK
jgi:hypothetical protein